MSAYEQIRNRLIKDKDGFSLWKKVVAGMSAGGKPTNPKVIILISSRLWTVYGIADRPCQNPDSDGGEEEVSS